MTVNLIADLIHAPVPYSDWLSFLVASGVIDLWSILLITQNCVGNKVVMLRDRCCCCSEL